MAGDPLWLRPAQGPTPRDPAQGNGAAGIPRTDLFANGCPGRPAGLARERGFGVGNDRLGRRPCAQSRGGYRLSATNSPIGMLDDASLYAGSTPEKPATDQETSQSATARTWYLPFGNDGFV